MKRGTLRVPGYLFTRGHRRLGDAKLSLLCEAMLVVFVAVQVLAGYVLITLDVAGAVAANP